MSRFTSILQVSPLADGRTWVLRSEFGYDVGAEGSNDQITIPVGFQTDFASIPRPFWAVLPKWGTYGNAAVIHDWLYWKQDRSRADADAVLLEGMVVFGVSSFVRYTIYTAVRLFGWLAWYRNQADLADGYQRVLKTLPTKATETCQRRSQYVQITRHVLKRTRAGRASEPLPSDFVEQGRKDTALK
jgi:hypothetical protein